MVGSRPGPRCIQLRRVHIARCREHHAQTCTGLGEIRVNAKRPFTSRAGRFDPGRRPGEFVFPPVRFAEASIGRCIAPVDFQRPTEDRNRAVQVFYAVEVRRYPRLQVEV